MNGKRVKKDNRKRIVELYAGGKMSRTALARKFRVSSRTVARCLADAGIGPGSAPKKVPEELKERAVALYRAGKSYVEVAAELGLCETSVWRWVAQRGIGRVTRTPTAECRQKVMEAWWRLGTVPKVAKETGICRTTVRKYVRQAGIRLTPGRPRKDGERQLPRFPSPTPAAEPPAPPTQYAMLGRAPAWVQRRAEAWETMRGRLAEANGMPEAERRRAFFEIAAKMNCSPATVRLRANRLRREMGVPWAWPQRRTALQESARYCPLLGAECAQAQSCSDRKGTHAFACKTAIGVGFDKCGKCPKKNECGHPEEHKLWECWKRWRSLSACECLDRAAKQEMLV